MAFFWTINSSPIKVGSHSQKQGDRRLLVPLTAATMKLSFSLKAKDKPVGNAPALKKPLALSSFDDDEPIDAASSLSDIRKSAPNTKLIAQNAESSKAMKKRMEAEKLVDETVYDYDGIYDKMQEAKKRQKEAKEADTQKREVSANWSDSSRLGSG